jgi:hypothetical protein
VTQEGEEAQKQVEKEKIALLVVEQQRLVLQLEGIQEEQLIQPPNHHQQTNIDWLSALDWL